MFFTVTCASVVIMRAHGLNLQLYMKRSGYFGMLEIVLITWNGVSLTYVKRLDCSALERIRDTTFVVFATFLYLNNSTCVCMSRSAIFTTSSCLYNSSGEISVIAGKTVSTYLIDPSSYTSLKSVDGCFSTEDTFFMYV